MAMIMSVQRLKESGERETEGERGVGQIFADKTAARAAPLVARAN